MAFEVTSHHSSPVLKIWFSFLKLNCPAIDDISNELNRLYRYEANALQLCCYGLVSVTRVTTVWQDFDARTCQFGTFTFRHKWKWQKKGDFTLAPIADGV